ncbi:MAG: hypothetical protein DMD49_07365 [Gemmatimonadetes bacterium]|nr:MAG: hypothetical protein DMD49_07365 [Gemmatimonadota bacterium]
MTRTALGLLALLHTVALAAQAPAPLYRGFAPGMGYREFAARARALSDRDMLRCNTSTNTARIMECGVAMRDPADSARFYLSAHFIDGNADVVALYDSAGFGDNRGARLVDATRRHLTRVYGRPRVVKRGMWEWRYGRQAVRLSWRGRASARWVSITLTDYTVMDRISRFVTPGARRKS